MKIKDLGLFDYGEVWRSMVSAIDNRSHHAPDEVWFVEHPTVYTLGYAGSEKNIITKKDIPVVRSDRGGQVTYHGPGQLVVYFLINIKRLRWGPKKLIFYLEETFISLLGQYKIKAKRKEGAPGIYVADQKIASIGLKIKRGFCYHGVSLNVDMDLSPFDGINTCGHKALEVTQVNDLASVSLVQIKEDLKNLLEDRSLRVA